MCAKRAKRLEVNFFVEMSTRDYFNVWTAGRSPKQILSKQITVGDTSTCRAVWELQVIPHNCCVSLTDTEKAFVHLKLADCNQGKIYADYSLGKVGGQSILYSVDFTVGQHHGHTWELGDYVELFECRGMCYFEKPVSIEVPDYRNTLIGDMQLLFEEHPHSDVTLRCAGGCLPAHKAILTARSPVFKAMFEHSYRESETGNVDVEDVEYEVFKEMLRYIYTGKQPEQMDDMAEQLLSASNKYGLEELKMMCEQHFSSTFTVDNVIRILVLADTHNSGNLKTEAQKFIREQKEDVLKTRDWEEMFFSRATLAFETVQRICMSV